MEAAQDGEWAVKADRASFAWEHEMPSVVHDISLKAIKGQLVMVVGAVGSGKSSLIAALLGELHARDGSLQVFSMCRAHKSPFLSYMHVMIGVSADYSESFLCGFMPLLHALRLLPAQLCSSCMVQ
jgi:ABC-type Mn2+/Zn2+ transport system ATPase subunit